MRRPKALGQDARHDAVEEAMLTEARVEVGTADQKASILLAALGVGFGAVLAAVISSEWSPADLGPRGGFVWWVGAILAACSIGSAGLAVWPRFVVADADQGIYFWGHVATFKSIDDLVKALARQSPSPGMRRRHQLWRLSRIVSRKYNLVRLALVLAALSVFLFALASALGGNYGGGSK